MIGLASETKDQMLAVFTGQALTVGLFDGDTEISDPRYQRLPIEFGAPQGGDTRYVENVNEVRFDDMGRDHQVDRWGVFDASGALMALQPLTKPRDLPAEDNAVFRPGSLRVGIP